MRRALTTGALALTLAGGLVLTSPLAGPAATPVAAAASADSYVTGNSTYDLDPTARVVRVSAAMTFEDTKADSDTIRYYFTGYRMGIQKEAQHVAVTSGGKSLSIALSPATDAKSGAAYQVLDVKFGTRISHGHTEHFTVTYELPDGGPRTSGLIRIGPAVAAFYAWSYGADEASVTVHLPAGFEPTVEGGPLTRSQAADGSTTLAASHVKDPASWAAWVTAERPSGLGSVRLEVPIEGQPETVEIRSFPEDEVWLDAVRQRLSSALPTLGTLIGLPWPASGPLVVSEAYAPLLGGYAGLYQQADAAGRPDSIRITEDPDPLVIVHEASHAWFNGNLFDGRWIAEGLADEYASRTLAAEGETGFDPEQVSHSDPAAFPLEAWPPPGPITDPQSAAAERYGYNAAWTVIRSLVTEIGEQRMAAVLQAARARTIPYVGRPAAESYVRGGGVPDWHVLLDLLEQVGGSHAAEGLFRTWVVGPAQATALADHSVAIEAYAKLLQDGQGWLPGIYVRKSMAAWDFATAQRAMAEAEAVLAVRDRVTSLAEELHLRPTGALRETYESAATSLAGAQAMAEDELSALQAIGQARRAVAEPRDILTTVGLLDAQPQAALDEAAAAFEAGHLAEARLAAARAEEVVAAAPALGRQRLLWLAAGLVALLLLAALAALLVRHRWARTRAAVRATGTLPASHAARPQATRAEDRPGHREGP
ncbi:MAG TPA: hypothetical protein VFW92_01920 [Candidatus Limnocylindrales bacterium]|nr:hypothetical protein [Candidatus Limnocylindrales bacterium]